MNRPDPTNRGPPRSGASSVWDAHAALAIAGIILLAGVGGLANAPRTLGVSDSTGTSPVAIERALPSPHPTPTVRAIGGWNALGSATVRFGVQALYVSASFTPTVSVGNGSVGVGNRSEATVHFAGSSAVVALTVPGVSGTNLSAPALGTQSVLVPGINDTVGGVPLSIYLDVNGQVNATTFVGGDGSGGGAKVVWTAPGNLTVPFLAIGAGRGTLEAGVANLSYFLTVGVVAKGTVSGFPVSVNLLAPAPLPSAPGTPSSVVGVFSVVPPPPIPPALPHGIPRLGPSPASHSAPISVWELALLIAAVLGVAVAVGVALWRRSRGHALPPTTCPACGHAIPPGSSYCPGCARPVLDAPASSSPPSGGAS